MAKIDKVRKIHDDVKIHYDKIQSDTRKVKQQKENKLYDDTRYKLYIKNHGVVELIESADTEKGTKYDSKT